MVHDHTGTPFVLRCDDEVAPVLRRPVRGVKIDHEQTEDIGVVVVVVVGMLPEVMIGRGWHGIIVTIPPIGPLSGSVLVFNPDRIVVVGRTVEDQVLDRIVHDELVVGRDVVVVVGHASIVPEEERKTRANKRNPGISTGLPRGRGRFR